jgi:prepilin-type processing-associated H-X9-DG protein
LLNALELDERRAIDEHLENNPKARRDLVALRRLLQPLADEAQVEIEPAGDLHFRTLRAVAGLRGREQTRQSIVARGLRAAPLDAYRRLRWRRADVLVAACIALVVLILVPPAILQVRHRQQIVACADNLHLFHQAIQQYANDRHGALPAPEADTPWNNAGIYAAKLREAGYWTGALQVNCPANNRTGRVAPEPPTLDMLQRYPDESEEHERCLRQMGGCYAYNLGYEEGGRYIAVSRDLGDGTPVIADRPFRRAESADWLLANSPNHAGRGQNVLFLGGHVRFTTTRIINDDDIFLNRDRHLAPGRGLRDVVLAPSETRAKLDTVVGEGD